MSEPPRESSSDRWARVDAAFRAALHQPPEERAAWVRQHFDSDPALCDEVLALLADDVPSRRLFDAAERERDAVAASAAREETVSVDLVGRHIGPYRLEALLATGGMGAVYRAERNDGEFQQTVAIKILPAWATDRQTAARLRAERQMLSGLQHPNITRLLDGGRTGDGYPYLVTEFIEGQSLTDFAARNHLDLSQRLALMADIADAVAYAHRQGIVHRDLKPANILVDRDGRPHLLDFGIARLLEAGDSPVTVPRTATGFSPMTPEYASPEQLRGEKVGIPSDVFQLGLLLYRLLTGSRHSVSGRGGHDSPTRPSSAVLAMDGQCAGPSGLARQDLARALRGDLDTIILKALRDDPAERYRSAGDLARDLRHYLAGEAIEAKPETPWAAGRRLARHHPAAAGLAALLFALLLVWAGSLSFYARELEGQRDVAAREAARAGQVRDVLLDIFRRSDPLQSDTIGGRTASVWDALDAAEEEARAKLSHDPEVLAELLSTLSVLQGHAGERERSLELLEEVITLYRGLGSGFEAERAVHLSELALQRDPFDQDAARPAREEAEGLLESHLGNEPQAAVAVLLDLASLEKGRGEFARSLAFYDEAHARMDEHGLNAWSLRIEALSGGADALAYLGRLESAEARLRRALALTETHFGVDHARMNTILGALGQLERRRGNFDGAVVWGERLLANMEGDNATTYDGLLAAKNNLALAYGGAGRRLEEQATLRELVRLRRQLAGASAGRGLAVNLKNLASSLHRTGDFEAARSAVLEARSLMERHYPPDSPIQATPWFTFGLVALDSGQAAEAEPALRKTLGLLVPALGDAHYQVQVTRCILAESLRRQGRGESARSLAVAALTALEGGETRQVYYTSRCRDTVQALEPSLLSGTSGP